MSNNQTGFSFRLVANFDAKCAPVSKVQQHFDFLASHCKAGNSLDHLPLPFANLTSAWPLLWSRRKVGSAARHVLRSPLLHLPILGVWRQKWMCAVRFGVPLQITMWAPCSTTVASRQFAKSGQCHFFAQIWGWYAAWSISKRSTPPMQWNCQSGKVA